MFQFRGLFAALISLFVASTAAAAQAKTDGKPTFDKAKLVGIWIFVEGPGPKDQSAQIEFTKDGKVIVTLDGKPKDANIETTYAVDGDQLTVTRKGPDGKEKKETQTIKTLTDSKFVFGSKNGGDVGFKRAPAK